MTEPGTLIGSFDYTAPEQLEDGDVDARTDVYALGCVLYETLTGEVPYPRDTPAAKMYAHLGAPIPHVRRPARPRGPHGRWPSTPTTASRPRARSGSRRREALGSPAPAAAPPKQPTPLPPALLDRDGLGAVRRPRPLPRADRRAPRRGRTTASGGSC